MKDVYVTFTDLKQQENVIKANQAKQANDLVNYLSEKIGIKLTPTETYNLSIEMFDTDPMVRFLMKDLEKLLKEQSHISELVSCVNLVKENLKNSSCS